MLHWFFRAARIRKERWDSHCRRCGLCCYEKGYYRSRVFIDLDRPCRYLNEGDCSCVIYGNRLKTFKECKKLTLFHALFCDYLPADCGYVRKFRPWRRFFPSPLFRGSRNPDPLTKSEE